MSIFENNITFAILNSKEDWQGQLTLRHCEHFSRTFNGENFANYIVNVATIDEALSTCTTQYLIVQESGHIISDGGFFSACSAYFKVHRNFMLADFMLDDDYCVVNKNVIAFDVERWKLSEKPEFSSHTNTGPVLKVLEKSNDLRFPLSIALHPTESVLISRHCANNGAALIIADIQRAASFSTMKKHINSSHYYFLRRDSAFHELYTETFYDKNFYSKISRKIYLSDPDNYEAIPKISADSLVLPARGLKAANLAQYTGAKHIVIYDTNALALEFQRRLLSVKRPELFGDIVAQFKKDYPSAEFTHDNPDNEFTVVNPLSLTSLNFIQLDLFSYECLNIVKFVDDKHSAVFDFSDSFIHPNNYFKKRLENVAELFEATCSVVKSRRGPSFILGESPLHRNMNDVKVNTVTISDLIQDVPLEDYESWQTDLQPASKEPEPIISAPTTPKSGLSEEFEKIKEIAVNGGYEVEVSFKEVRQGKVAELKITKIAMLPDFNCVYEYKVSSSDNRWSFKINKYGHEKKLELSNGNTVEGLKLHLEMINKFNSKAVAKML